MAIPPLQNVRILALREIAEMWAAHELQGVPVQTILRELQLAVINIPRLRAGDDLIPIEEYPLDNELPDPDERVDRDWLIEFCGKQGWQSPSFWFVNEPDEQQPDRFPGRPGYPYKPVLKRELKRRAQSGEMHDTLAAEMRRLREWAIEQYPDATPPTFRVLENAYRHLYRDLKNNP